MKSKLLYIAVLAAISACSNQENPSAAPASSPSTSVASNLLPTVPAAMEPGEALRVAMRQVERDSKGASQAPSATISERSGRVQIDADGLLSYFVVDPLVWNQQHELVGGALQVVVDREPEEPAIVTSFAFKPNGHLTVASGLGPADDTTWQKLQLGM